MDVPVHTVEQFLNTQIDAVLEKYPEYKKNEQQLQ